MLANSRFLPFLLILISVVFSAQAEGNQITVEFSGRIYLKTNGSHLNFPGLVNGVKITGYARYDTAVTGDLIAENLVAYQQEAMSSLVIKAAGYEFSSDGDFVTTVYNKYLGTDQHGNGVNDSRFTLSDTVIEEPDRSPRPFPEIGETVLVDGNPTDGEISLTFIDTPTASLTPGLELPSLIDSSIFETGEGEVSVNIPYVFREGNQEITFFDQTRFLFFIDSFRTVPEPATILLFVTLLGTQAICNRSKRN